MKTKNIFKTLAFAMLMPTMLLTTACSSEDDLVNNTAENTVANKGYALPVTVNVSRQGDGTRATYTYDEGTKKGTLAFSTGDELFVKGWNSKAGDFAGTLEYDAVSGKFSGTLTTQEQYTGTIDDLMEETAAAFLLADGYGSYGFFSIEGSGSEATITYDDTKAFALTKAAAVEQFSFEQAFEYNNGFALAPANAIVSFTINGLTANKEVAVSFDISLGTISGNVTTSAEGVATFAIGVSQGKDLEDCTLTVDGNNIEMPTATTAAGHIYNIDRSATPPTDLSTINANYEAKDGETLTGTLASNVKISIADGATVTLKDVTINGVSSPDYGWAGITCAGDATITLEGANTVKGFQRDYPGIYVPEGKTLTIEGEGSLNASGNGYSTGIGGGYYMDCGDIVINGGNITATGGDYNAGIGGGEGGSCGAITINGGTVTATGGGNAAGIGGGYDANCGNITISGGNVTATGGQWAAGIGGGKRGNDSGSCGNITISGGTITATGGNNAAGIGGGTGRSNSNPSSCGTITITSGVTSVTATKGSSAPNSIGAGYWGTCGTVTIEDGANVIQK